MLILVYIIPINKAANKGFFSMTSVKKGNTAKFNKNAIGMPLPDEKVALPNKYLTVFAKSSIFSYLRLNTVT